MRKPKITIRRISALDAPAWQPQYPDAETRAEIRTRHNPPLPERATRRLLQTLAERGELRQVLDWRIINGVWRKVPVYWIEHNG